MTVLLILACITIAGAELYMARSSRKLTDRLDELEAVAIVHNERLNAMATKMTDTSAHPRQLPAANVHRPDAESTLPATETIRPSERLARLEDAPNVDRNLGGNVDRHENSQLRETMESLKRRVDDLYRHTLSSLDEAVTRTLGGVPPGRDTDSDTVRGAVWGAAVVIQNTLPQAYERCVAEVGLRIRFRAPSTTMPRYISYYLCGKTPRELERDCLFLLESVSSDPAPSKSTPSQSAPSQSAPFQPVPSEAVPEVSIGSATAAFRHLLVALNQVGTGFAQIGPMVAVRVRGTLLCGVLTLAECRTMAPDAPTDEPSAMADRLRKLPPERLRDLTACTATATATSTRSDEA